MHVLRDVANAFLHLLQLSGSKLSAFVQGLDTVPVCAECCAAQEEESRRVFWRNGAVEEFKSKKVRNVIWNNDVVAGNLYEADGRLFREALAPLYSIPITAAAVPMRGAAPLAALAAAGIRELPAQVNERALSRWDRETLRGPRGRCRVQPCWALRERPQ